MRRILKTVAIGVGVLALGAACWGGWTVWNNLTQSDRRIAASFAAGMVEKQTEVGGVRVNYGEGPANGPALLLIHGQAVDWKNYAGVLPELTQRYHVFAVDCFGHGGSGRDPRLYTAATHGAALQQFADAIIGEPYLVSGHSSGGQLAAWLAAHDPGVRGVLLEDPPFFTTTLPRARTTWNYVDLATSAHEFLASGETDWVLYAHEHQRMWIFFGDSAEWFKQMGRDHHAKHPDEGIRYWAMPPLMNESGRAMPDYDPHFGDAFYRGTWDDGWDQAETLARVDVPSTLVHTKVEYGEDGILMAAMGHEEAARARDLLDDVRFHKTETSHGFHDEAPDEYIGLVDDLATRAGMR